MRVVGTREEHGPHELALTCKDKEGKQLFAIKGTQPFRIPETGGTIHAVISLDLALPGTNSIYTFAVRVDGSELADWPIEVIESR